MTFLNPAALWLLPLVALPLLLARRGDVLERRVVSALYLWRAAIGRETGRPSFDRVRRRWIVALQMAGIAAAVLALSGPAVRVAGSVIVLVFDVSASMAARQDRGSSRIELAHRRALAIVSARAPASRVRLVAAGASPHDLGDYAAADPRLGPAIDAIEATAGTADLSAAVAFAAANGDTDRIVVLTDTSGAGPRAVERELVGAPADNAAILRVAARPAALGRKDGEVLVVVRNYGTHARDTDVEIASDSGAVHRTHIELPAAGTRELTIALPSLGHLVTARLQSGDALSVDDARTAVVPGPIRVGLLGLRGSFLERALQVHPGVSLQSPTDPDLDVIVCERCDDAADGTSTLAIDSRGGEALRGPVTIADAAHPLASALEVGDQSAAIFGAAADDAADVVLRVGGVPAVTASDRDGRRLVAVHLDLSQPDFALSPAFPVLVANALDWLAARRHVPDAIAAGEPLVITARSPSSSIRVVGPDRRPRQLIGSGQRLVVADTGVAGEYRVAVDGVEHAVAVQPVVDGESNLAAPAGAPAAGEGQAGQVLAAAPVSVGRWLALAAMMIVAIEWRLRAARRRRIAWRTATVGLLLLAASGVTIASSLAPVTVVAALDRSSSLPGRVQQEAVARVRAFTAGMRSGDRLGVVAFGADAALEARPSASPEVTAVRSAIDATGTDIGRALRLARSVLPDRGARRIVLVSDGRETTGSAEREAAAAAHEGVAIDVVPAATVGDPPRVTRVVAPGDAAIDEPYTVSIEVAGSPGWRGPVAVYRDDAPIARQEVTIGRDRTGSVSIVERAADPRAYVYRAAIESAEPADSSPGAVVVVEGQPAVLYVSASSAVLGGAVDGGGFRLTRVAPEQVPATASGLGAFAAVVLDDVPAERLRLSSLEALSAYVAHDGGGLLLLGGSRTLALGGYPTTPLEPILPIDLRPREGQQTPAVELVIVFDKSGSMADVADGLTKIEAARQTVLRVFDLMPPGDRIGVLAFDSSPTTIAPLDQARDSLALRTLLRQVVPGGATSIAPAVETAFGWLLAPGRPPAARRQVLLVSDGRTSDADADRLRTLVRSGGVQLSAFAIGPTANRPLLEELAAESGGRAYFPDDLRELPRVVAREAARSAGGGVVLERFLPKVAPHPVVAGIEAASVPALGGYVVSRTKPTAAAVLGSHLDDPILAAWRSGLGRVVVFTADLRSPSAAGFREWRDGGRLWRQTLRWLSRDAGDPLMRVTLLDSPQGPRLVVDARESGGTFLDLDGSAVVIRTPAGVEAPIPLDAIAPGYYEARIPVTDSGAYVAAVTARERRSHIEHRVVRALYWSADRESRARGADLPLLSRIAALTGGRVLGDGATPFDGEGRSGVRDVLPWAAGSALALFVLDLATVGRFGHRTLRQRRQRHGRPGKNRAAA